MRGLFQPFRAHTLHIPETGPDGQGHLFVILTETCPAGLNLLVPICSQRGKFDPTCLLGVGDHDFIKHPSFVMYSRLRLFEAKNLVKRVNDGSISYEGMLDAKVFAYVASGVETSRFTALKMKEYFRDQSRAT